MEMVLRSLAQRPALVLIDLGFLLETELRSCMAQRPDLKTRDLVFDLETVLRSFMAQRPDLITPTWTFLWRLCSGL